MWWKLPRLHLPKDPLIMKVPSRGHVEDDWRAKPDSDHPWPVILIHGTTTTNGDFSLLAKTLRRNGWAVFAPAYGRKGTRPIEDSAAQVGAYIDQVLCATGAKKVILIGHSQGGVLARWWMKNLGGAAKTKHVICLGSPNHGTSMGGLIHMFAAQNKDPGLAARMIDAYVGPSGRQQITGSAFLTELNGDGECWDTPTGEPIYYTNIATRSDTIVMPPSSCFLAGPEDQVTNIWIQDLYPLNVVTHFDLPRDRRTRHIIADAVNRTVHLR